MSTHKNRVKMTVSGTPGTGTITLGSASSGYQSFATAYGGNATVDILIVEGTAWEVARDCTYTNAGTTVTRGTLEASSTGSAVSFTSAAVVSEILTATKGTYLEIALKGHIPGGRLTLESGVPVSTTDQTAKTTIYYTPFVHNVISLWDGANWVPTEFIETSLAIGTITSGKPYDVFGYLSGGVLALEMLVWTNDTSRATAVTLQDGRYCKNGDKTRLLLGTFYTTSTTTTEDSLAARYLWNAYNRVSRRIYAANSTSHTYTTGSWREWNGGTGVTKLNILSGIGMDAMNLSIVANLQLSGTGTIGYINIGYDSTSGTGNLLANLEGYGSASSLALSGSASVAGPLGRHYATCVEFGVTNVTYAAYSLQGNFPC